LKIEIKEDDLTSVFGCLDRDGSGALDLIEIYKILELSPFDIINN
jgi:hypothetical protein